MVADVLTRLATQTRGVDPSPDRGLGTGPWRAAEERRDRVTADAFSSGGGSNDCGRSYWGPLDDAFDGNLPLGRLWRFPRRGRVGAACALIAASREGGGSGEAICLCPAYPSRRWVPRMKWFAAGVALDRFSRLFAPWRGGR